MLLISCKIQLKLEWTKQCVLSANGNDNAKNDNNANNIIFHIKDKKLHVSVIVLSATTKSAQQRFERSVYWNKYKIKNNTKNTTNENRYFTESNFAGVKRLFTLIFF